MAPRPAGDANTDQNPNPSPIALALALTLTRSRTLTWQYGDEQSKDLALEVTQKINEAMTVAKKNAKQRGEAF